MSAAGQGVVSAAQNAAHLTEGQTAFVIPLRLVINEATAREWYADYRIEWQWYKDNEPWGLTGESPSYRSDAPETWDEWFAGLLEGILSDVLDSSTTHSVELATADVDHAPAALAGADKPTDARPGGVS